jgi:ABC-type Fe3+-citrate transport system substrate-binding protein
VGAFAFIIANRWTWYALGAVVLAGALLGVRAHYIHVGNDQGKEQQKEDTQKEVELGRRVAEREMEAKVAKANAEIAAAQAKQKESEAAVARYEVIIGSLVAQRGQARQQVAQLGDSALHGYIRAKVGVLPPDDPTPGYVPAEERVIADAVTQQPLIEKQLAAHDAEISELKKNAQNMKDELAGVMAREAANDSYTTEVLKAYTTVFNLHPPKKRSGKCVWAWHCVADKLAAPNPKELEAKRPK